jgi:hypothetical protein
MGWYVNLPALKPQANPIIKLLNKKYVPKESVKPGIEGGEAEIDESLLDPENVVDITSVDQLVELKNILLAHADPNVPEVKFVFRYIDSLIRQFNEIERIKKVIETRDFQKGQSIA